MRESIALTFDYGNATFTADLTPDEARYIVTHINKQLDELEETTK